MFSQLKRIGLSNWILIAMILGLITGIILNLYVDDYFIKDVLLMNNVFYLGGNLFIRLMKMLVVPLVFFSIVMSLASLSDIRNIGTIGLKSILLFFLTTIIALAVALVTSAIIKPGIGLNIGTNIQYSNGTLNQTITSTILNIVPENPLNALITGDMLPIILFAIMIGFILVKLNSDKTKTVYKLFDEANEIMITMTNAFMKFAPVGVFCLMARTFGNMGFETLIPLAKLISCVIVEFAVMVIIVYPALILIFTRQNPLKFFKKYISVMLFAFSSMSSSAALPLNLAKLEELGVSREISSFTIPLGTSLNQNGAAIIFGTGIIFGCQAYGIDLGTTALLTAIFTILLTSISTPSVPLAGIFSLNVIFTSIGLPVAVLELMAGIYNILDMFITTSNVTGNGVSTFIVGFNDKSFDMNAFNNEKDIEKSVEDL
ncbi:dicarboxylate/amino acid:cation symporter [Methanobrevibacter sp.]